MKDFIREWSLQEKTVFPINVEFLVSIKKSAEMRAKEENFMYHDETPDLLYYPRKGVSIENLKVALASLIQRNTIPANLEELYQGWCYFRIIDPIRSICDCGQFYKYGYCKHTIAVQIFEGILADPEIKEKKKRGRKANITKALQK